MNRVLSNLGLCNRAGGLVSGEEIVLESMAGGKVKYVFLATDASEGAKKKIRNKAMYYHVEVDEGYSSAELSMAIGKFGRMVIGITNENFLKILKK